MKRRDALELVVIGSAVPAAAQPHVHSTALQAAAAAPRFFAKAQFDLIDRLAEMIIPADAHSPGAKEARVAAFIDDFVADSDARAQADWTNGLAAVDAEASKRFGSPFLACGADRQETILREMAEGELNPLTELHRFFTRIKMQTISGYYTSPIGLLKDLQYKGNAALTAFPPCNHPDHHKPEGGRK